LRYDDALDVVAVHLVAGIIGTVMIGFFAFPHEDGPAGLLYGGGFELLIAQVLACLVAIVFAGLVTFAISLVLRSTMGLRIDPREELDGMHTVEHAQQAYSSRGRRHRPPAASSPAAAGAALCWLSICRRCSHHLPLQHAGMRAAVTDARLRRSHGAHSSGARRQRGRTTVGARQPRGGI